MNGFEPDISVVILCYRAEDYAPVFVSQMKSTLGKKSLKYELVLVANYERDLEKLDRTPEIANRLAAEEQNIRVVAKPKDGMMGWDMRSGLEAATGKTIAVIDGDGQMASEDVLRVYDLLVSEKYDMAMTYRTKRGDGLVRRLISRTYNFFLKMLFPKVTVRDANSKPKIFTRDAYNKLYLTSNDWFIDAEIIIQASALKFRIGEIPTLFFKNPKRASFINMKAIFNFFKDLVFYRVNCFFHGLPGSEGKKVV